MAMLSEHGTFLLKEMLDQNVVKILARHVFYSHMVNTISRL